MLFRKTKLSKMIHIKVFLLRRVVRHSEFCGHPPNRVVTLYSDMIPHGYWNLLEGCLHRQRAKSKQRCRTEQNGRTPDGRCSGSCCTSCSPVHTASTMQMMTSNNRTSQQACVEAEESKYQTPFSFAAKDPL